MAHNAKPKRSAREMQSIAAEFARLTKLADDPEVVSRIDHALRRAAREHQRILARSRAQGFHRVLR